MNVEDGEEDYLQFFNRGPHPTPQPASTWNDIPGDFTSPRGYVVEWDTLVPLPAPAFPGGLGLAALFAARRRRRRRA